VQKRNLPADLFKIEKGREIPQGGEKNAHEKKRGDFLRMIRGVGRPRTVEGGPFSAHGKEKRESS